MTHPKNFILELNCFFFGTEKQSQCPKIINTKMKSHYIMSMFRNSISWRILSKLEWIANYLNTCYFSQTVISTKQIYYRLILKMFMRNNNIYQKKIACCKNDSMFCYHIVRNQQSIFYQSRNNFLYQNLICTNWKNTIYFRVNKNNAKHRSKCFTFSYSQLFKMRHIFVCCFSWNCDSMERYNSFSYLNQKWITWVITSILVFTPAKLYWSFNINTNSKRIHIWNLMSDLSQWKRLVLLKSKLWIQI